MVNEPFWCEEVDDDEVEEPPGAQARAMRDARRKT